MNRQQIDQLYHLLRVASNEGKDPAQAFSTQQLVYGLAHHLLAGGDYQALIQYSAFYGEKFLLEPTCTAVGDTEWEFDRVVEFGAGFQWLGRGLANEFDLLPTLFVDKRPWTLIDVVADLETPEGRENILSYMHPNDLIVMSDVLHCLNNPKEVMSAFSEWPLVVLEYCPKHNDYRYSYSEQIGRCGAKFIEPRDYSAMFSSRRIVSKDLDPYVLLLVEAEG